MSRRLPVSPRLAVLPALVLLGFALRVYNLGLFSLRGDESLTLLIVQKPLAEMWDVILHSEPHPPLIYFLLRGWTQWAGPGEFAARFFSAWFGVLCIPLIYQLGRALFYPARRARTAAAAAAFLVAINPFQIWYSQDVRDYTLWPALSMAGLIGLWAWLNRLQAGSSRRAALAPLALFFAAELVALYTHYFEALALLALNVFVIALAWRKRQILLPWLVTQLALAVLYLPYALVLSNRVALYDGSGRQGLALWDVWRQSFGVLALGETVGPALALAGLVPFVLAAALGAWSLWQTARDRLWFFAAYISVPTVTLFAVSLARPLFFPRYLAMVAPAYYLLAAAGIAVLLDWPARGNTFNLAPAARVAAAALLAAFVLLSLTALGNYFIDPAYAKSPDWRALAQAIAAEHRDGDVIVQNFGDPTLVYYNQSGLRIVVLPAQYAPDERTPVALDKLNEQYRRIWFIPSSGDYWDPDGFVESWLSAHDERLSETPIDTFRLQLYKTPGAAP